MGIRIAVRSLRNQATGSVVYEFDQEKITLGRGNGTDVRLPDRTVSALHATLRAQREGYVLVDESSTNGTRVNEILLISGRPKAIRSGDEIAIGCFRLRLDLGVAVSMPTSAERTDLLARRLVREALEGGPEAIEGPRLAITAGPDVGCELEFAKPPSRVVVGRAEECDLVLRDPDASREHFELVRDLDGVVIRDLDSKNGIAVNGRPVKERRLRDRDELSVGDTRLRFTDPATEHLRALDQAPDEAAPHEAPAPPPAEPETPPPAEPTLAPRPARRRTTSALDLAIYVIAAAVLGASLIALFLLMRVG